MFIFKINSNIYNLLTELVDGEKWKTQQRTNDEQCDELWRATGTSHDATEKRVTVRESRLAWIRRRILHQRKRTQEVYGRMGGFNVDTFRSLPNHNDNYKMSRIEKSLWWLVYESVRVSK